MHLKNISLLIFCIFLACTTYAQTATITGTVLNQENKPLVSASVSLMHSNIGTQTNLSGSFKLTVPAIQDILLIISHIGYVDKRLSLTLKPGETRQLLLKIEPNSAELKAVEITGQDPNSTRNEVSITRLEPRHTKEIPTVFGDFNKILNTLPGVSSNNELTSTYSVRGGNYDENLVYVNGIEIYRPFLVTNGQQEGLSFVNPDLVQNIEFSAGGWQPKYGDKLSSVLNIEYRKPTTFTATATAGFLGGGLHLEGISQNKKFTYLVGGRYKNAQLLFNKSLETSGNYQPKFGDFQTYLTYDLSNKYTPGKTTLSFLGSVATNKYLVIPSTRQTTFGTINRFIRLNVGYTGRERMDYNTYQGGINLNHAFSEKYRSEIIFSALLSRERELRTIEAGYNFCDVDTVPDSENFNKCVSQRDVGTNFEHARNFLRAMIFALETRHIWEISSINQVRWGLKWNQEQISDNVQEYNFTDSADFVRINQSVQSDLNLFSHRLSGFAQQTISTGFHTLTYGFRANYWTYNKEFTISPRVQYAFTLPQNKNISLKFATGLYYQPPFYRELRDLSGNLNSKVKAQQSWHIIAGSEYRFKAWNRDFKLTNEGFYKYLTRVVPYEVDNVQLRYFAKNNAKAYAAGFDTRVNGEFIKGAESWFSLGLLTTRENIAGDSANIYEPGSRNIKGKKSIGYIRRPTDQWLNIGVFFQDHIPNDPSLKMYLNLLFGSGLPFGPPGREEFRNKSNMPAYNRIDVGFSKLITLQANETTPGLESLWLSLEVLNLISYNNVVSYDYITDINNITYSVPNYLSSRLLNLRIIARF